MQSEVVEVSPIKREVKINYTGAEVDQAWKRSTKSVQDRVEIKGFRRGKAPLSVVQGQYKGEIQRDVLEHLLQDGVDTAMREHKLIPVGPIERAGEDLATPTAGEPVTFAVQFEIRPTIELQNVSGFEVTKARLDVGDKDLERELEKLQRRAAQLVPVLLRNSVEEKDFAVIDYEGTTLDSAQPVGQGKDAVVEMGGTQFLPGFSDKLLNMVVGTDRMFEIQVPDDHENKQIAGKNVHFKVHLKGIKKLELPSLDDELAKDVGAESLEALKTKLSEGLKSVQEVRIKNELREQLIDKLVAAHTFEVPQSLVADQTQLMFREVLRRAQADGMPLDQLGQEDFESLSKSYWPRAERNVRFYLLVGELAKRDNVAVSDEEVDAQIEKIAEMSREEVSRIRAHYAAPERREGLRFQLIEDKVLDALEKSAKITEGEPLSEDKRQLL